MDDYFAEAEEHIIAVRRSLLMLEAALGSDLPAAVLEDLFRSFHSLKGISAMVELREAELLAHHMESCLRAIRQGRGRSVDRQFRRPGRWRPDARRRRRRSSRRPVSARDRLRADTAPRPC